MKNDEAKFILAGYRPNGSDGSDPKFDEALRQVQGDPELSPWFARARAHDTAIAAKLGQITPPAGLREAILAGGRVSTTRRTAWRRPVWMAAAAAVAVLAVTAAAIWPTPAVANAPLVKFAMQDALELSRHGGHGDPAKEFQAELGQAATHMGQAVTVDFAALARSGCRTVDVEGRAVLEVCFNRNGAWFHCYVARVEDFPRAATHGGPVYADAGKVSAVTWSDGAHLFVVAGTAGREALARLL